MLTSTANAVAGRTSSGSTAGPAGMVRAMRQIVAEEGAGALWKGLSAGLQRQLVFASLRLSLYERIRDGVQSFRNGGRLGSGAAAAPPSLDVKILSGLLAGALGITVANPTDLVKVRLQAEGRLPPGVAPRYTGALDAYRKIVSLEGVTKLWTGLGPNIARNSVICAAELSTYDVAKEFALSNLGLPDNTLTHFGCGACAGMAGTLIGNPIDVVKTRVMNAQAGTYRNALDCFLQTLRHEGPLSFYRGAFPQFARITSWNIVMFVCYERYKKWAADYFRDA